MYQKEWNRIAESRCFCRISKAQQEYYLWTAPNRYARYKILRVLFLPQRFLSSSVIILFVLSLLDPHQLCGFMR